jgi:hypothetical protein
MRKRTNVEMGKIGKKVDQGQEKVEPMGRRY